MKINNIDLHDFVLLTIFKMSKTFDNIRKADRGAMGEIEIPGEISVVQRALSLLYKLKSGESVNKVIRQNLPKNREQLIYSCSFLPELIEEKWWLK